MAATRSNGADRTALTPQAIVERAITLADADGMEAVTIRRIARELGVTPMALYWHFGNKDELLDGMAARLFESVDLSVDASAAWQDQLRTVLESMVVELRAHPATARLLTIRTVSSEGSLDATERLLDILRRGGFAPSDATLIARHALNMVVSLATARPGFVSRNTSAPSTDAHGAGRDLLRALPPDRYPRLVEAADPLSESIDPDAYVAFGLDLLLAGIEAMAGRS